MRGRRSFRAVNLSRYRPAKPGGFTWVRQWKRDLRAKGADAVKTDTAPKSEGNEL